MITPVLPVASVTVVLLLNQLTPEQFPAIERDLLTLYSSLRRRPLIVALVREGFVGVAGPFANRLALKAVLDDVVQSIPTTPSPATASPGSILDALCLAAPKLGGKWSNALVIGDFPAVDPLNVDFASAMLLRAFTSQQVQLSWFPPSGGGDLWLPALRATGGNLIGTQLTDFATWLNDAPQFLFQIDWSPAPPSTGFVVSRAMLSDPQGQRVLETPDIASPADQALPSIEQYSAVRGKIAEAGRLLKLDPSGAETQGKIHEILQEALQANPRDASALEIAAAFSELRQEYHAAAGFRALLVEVRPQDPDAYIGLGHALLQSGDWDKSEDALKHAVSIGAPSQKIAEDLARVYLAKKDDKAALPFLDEALRADPRRQDLWFLQGDTAERSANYPLSVRSYRAGLALGGVHVSQTIALLRLLLPAKRNAEAQELARHTIPALPSDGAVRIQFASALDDLKMFGEALEGWKAVLDVSPGYGQAHYRLARLLLDSGDSRASEQAATTGLMVAANFAPLYVIKAEALSAENHMYEARRVLQQGFERAPEPILLGRVAEADDLSGGGASAYARLAESLTTSSPEREHALERGFAASVRDGDLQHAKSFAVLLHAAGHPEFDSLLGAELHHETGELVRGGLDALAFAAHAGEQIPRDRFFAEYCRAAMSQLASTTLNKTYIEAIHEHFQRVAALEALGKRNGDHVTISMSVDGKEPRHRTEKILDLLGIKLHASKGEVALNRGETKAQAKRQETVSALAVDEVAMQEAFQAGKPFSFDIVDERAPLYPNEKVWRDAFYPGESEPAGFASAVLRTPKIGQLYLALSSLDRHSVAALLAAVPLQKLDEHRAALLEKFGTAFAVGGDRAAVPGGLVAEPIWTTLVGVSPDKPGPFFRALLEKENGNLLAFFFTLSQLDRAHQAFFTAKPERLSRFYKLFTATEEMQHIRLPGETTFIEVLRSVPLDRQNHLSFPGSPEVWTVASGRSADEAKIAKLLKKISKAAAPELEDEVLLRLAETRYKRNTDRHTELDNFLAVSRIDAHRHHSLDDESALLLAQHFADFSEAYAYFTDLTALNAGDFRAFFSAVEHISSSPPIDSNLRLGQLHSLIEWICLLSRRRAISDIDAARLFRFVCDHLGSADNGAAYVNASVDSARAILSKCGKTETHVSADEQVRLCFLSGLASLDPQRDADFQTVLKLQNIPKLDTVFSIHNAASKLLSQTYQSPAAIETSAASLPTVEVPKTFKELGKQREAILRYDPGEVRKVAAELRLKSTKRKPNPKDIEKIARELIASLEPQVTAALAGQLYAYFLRPTDLIVRGDPLLVRKHYYFDFLDQSTHHSAIRSSYFNQESAGAGSYFSGGFAQFPLAVGHAASISWKVAGPAGEAIAAAEIAAIRSADWDQLEESDLRLVRLRTETAREWIFESATRREEFQLLSDETMGLLSLARRAELLNALQARNWNEVWTAITVPDLFALGGRFLECHKQASWPSPLVSALQSISTRNDGSRLNVLGAVTYHSYGCAHPHLQPNAPYEEYETHFMPDDIAERSAEFKIFLALQADYLGVEPASLARVAERLAAKSLRAVQMNNYRDWRPVLVGYSSLSAADLAGALEQ